MTLKNWNEISTNQFSLSNHFKTVHSYKYQIIAPTEILGLYVNNIRQCAIKPEHDSEEATLFPNYEGKILASGEITKKVENVFRYYGYHITITKLRDMISTHIEDMYRCGKLTEQGEIRLIS